MDQAEPQDPPLPRNFPKPPSRIQIFVALIAYLLLRLAQACQDTVVQPLAFARLIRLNLMHRRPITTLRQPERRPSAHQNQMVLI